MARRTGKIGLREVDAIQPSQVLWDTSVIGFGIRRQTGKAVIYVLKFRTAEGRQRWQTIGRHGSPWTPDTARVEARRLLGEVAQGSDPSADKQARRKAATVADLCDDYMAEAEAGRLLTRRKVPKKASTLLSDRGRVDRHIKPELGRLKVAAVTREDVDAFLHRIAEGATAFRAPTGKKRGLSNVRGGKGAATRTVGLLGAIFAYAIRRRLRADNPVHGVTRFADQKRERRLTDAEYAAMGRGLALVREPRPVKPGGRPRKNDGGMWPPAVAAVRFLLLTGWRSGEAIGLRRREVDPVSRTARLPDTKTGQSVRPLSHAACDLLKQVAEGRAAGDLLFPASRGSGPMTGFPALFARVVKAAELPPEITPHVLRHSFASLAGDLGYSELTIGALIGHRGASVTSRYVHAADAVLLAAANAVADRTAELMGSARMDGAVVALRAVR